MLFYAMNDPIDRFFVSNLDAFLNKPFDELVVDPANEALIENHLAPLAAETDGTVTPPDEAVLGSAFYEAAKKTGGTVPKGYRPHPRLNMRGGIGPSFQLKRGNEEIGRISLLRRFREAYIGAIFPFFGQQYRVHSHEENNTVVLAETEQYLRTDAGFYTALFQRDIFDGFAYEAVEVYYGAQNIITNFTGYKLIDERTSEVIREERTEASLPLNDLHAFWMNVPLSPNTADGIGALEHLFRVGAMFVIPADRFDTSTYSKTGEQPAAFYYENYRGGIGVAKKLFEVWPTALRKGIEIAEHCACKRGCPNCIEPAKSYDISNAAINKVQGIALARELLAVAQKGPNRKFRNGMMVAV